MTLSVAAVQAAYVSLLLVIRQWIELQYDAIVILMVRQRLPSIFRVCHVAFFLHPHISSLIELAVRNQVKGKEKQEQGLES